MAGWESIFDQDILQEGRRYFDMGKAKKLSRTADGYEAMVRGSRNYRVEIEMEGDAILNFSCTCGHAQDGHKCKHIAAAMYLLDDQIGVSEALNQNAAEKEDGFSDDMDYYAYDGVDDYIYEEPVNREDRRYQERENRRNRKERKKKEQRTKSNRMLTGTPAFEELFPELSEIQEEGTREIREDNSEADIDGLNKEYRYFHFEKFRNGLNITQKNLKEAKRLISQKIMLPVQVNQGYYTDRADSQMVGWAESSWRAGGNQLCQATITFSRDSLLSVNCNMWNCDCYYRSLTPQLKLCPHIIATLLMTEDYLRKENPGRATNYAGNQLMSIIGGRVDSEILTDAKINEGSQLSLEPVASLDGDNKLSVSFRVGGKKGYKIKQLRDFADCVRNREEMTFGKSTVMQFAPEFFAGESADWLHFIEYFLEEDEERRERRSTNISRYGYNIQTEKKISGSIPLYGLRLDQFFNLIAGKETEFSIPEDGRKKKKYLKAQDGDFRLQLELHANVEVESGAFQGIRMEGEAPLLIDGSDYSYYIKEDGIYREKKEEMRRIAPLLKEAYDGRINIQIGRGDLGEFYHKILPTIREAADIVEYDTDLIDTYIPPEPVFISYLDVQENSIVCRADVWYGSHLHLVSDQMPDASGGKRRLESYRDSQEEVKVLDILLTYMEHWDSELNIFFTPREDLSVFRFLEEGLNALMEVSEVRTTEAFRRLRIRRKIPFEVGISMDSGLLDLKLTSDELTKDELLEVFRSYHQKRTFIRLKNGDFFAVDRNETLEQLSEMMNALHISLKEFVAGKMHIPAYRALYLDKMLEQTQDVYADRDQHFRKLVKEFKTIEDADYAFPDGLKSVLRSYQRDGYRWLRTLDEYHFGGILADEMGLGKTLQAITVLLAAKEEKLTSIVVCPASLVYNWAEELHRFAPSLEVFVLAGTKAVRTEQIRESENADVLVTSYDLLKRDIHLYEDLTFRYIILDEAQYIKNRGTAAAKSVKLLRGRTRFALTGTPIENRLSELWSIFDFLMPGFLYEYTQFQQEFEIPIVKNNSKQAMERLRKMTAPFILRRLKKDVLKDLPEKLEEVRYSVMEKKQRRLYDAQVVRMRKDLRNQDEKDFRKGKIQILAELTKIRQICCDPSLLFSDYDGGSAKRESCIELIRSAVEGEHKTLVFSQFTTMLELLEESLNKEGIPYYKITGSTPKEKRIKLVKTFNEDRTPVFLISLKAGGTGLNLTGADIVIHYDPWWNLAAQNQATDRAHRIGQKNVVTVYKLIVKGTIEEKILDMQEQKKQLAEDVLEGEAVSSASISKEDLLALLE